MGPNRVRFQATFHKKPALGTLTFEDDGKFVCAFEIDDTPKVVWPFRGTWVRVGKYVSLVTPHGLVRVTLLLNDDQTLTGLSQEGGVIDINIRGSHSTPLPRELKDARTVADVQG